MNVLKMGVPRASIASLMGAVFIFSAAARAAVPTSQPSGDSPSDVQMEVRDLRSQMEQMKIREQDLEKKLQSALAPAAPTTQPASSAQGSADAGGWPVHEAELHTQFLSSLGMTAGYDPSKGFFLATDDGNYLLHPFLLLQVRDVTNFREDAKADGATDTENGFEIRRMQIGFEGNMFDPNWTYRIFIQTERSGGEALLFDAWVKYHFPDSPWYVEAGQFKSPFAHEQMVFDRTLLAADRTLTDDILADGEAFSQGVMGIYDNADAVRIKAQFTNGYGTNDVNFEDVPARPANFGLGARGEYKFMGNWKDYDQFSSVGDKQDLLVGGVGLDWSEGEPTEYIRQAADVQWNHGGLGLYGAYIGLYTGDNGNAGNSDTFDSSVIAQISYLMTPHWEAFGRYDYLKLDSKEFTAGTNTNVHEFTLGVNYYFYGQNLKVTLDGSYLPNGSPVDDNGSGVLVSDGHGELVARAQLQLAI